MSSNRKPITRRHAKIIALMLFALSVLNLIMCARWYLGDSWLRPEAPTNPAQIGDMKKLIIVAMFFVLPILSLLIMMSSRVIWKLSNQIAATEPSK
jgi:hypothetical protein